MQKKVHLVTVFYSAGMSSAYRVSKTTITPASLKGILEVSSVQRLTVAKSLKWTWQRIKLG